jgi:putative oxidoreductase
MATIAQSPPAQLFGDHREGAEPTMQLGLAVLRIILGGLLVGHGLQKLKGWFGGYGLQATGEAFETMGLRPGRRHALAAGLGETIGGSLLATGFLTPLGASVVAANMTVAIDRVHAPNGPWVADGGYEYNLLIIAAAVALADAGPGSWSLDERLGTGRRGSGVALAALAAGLAGGAAVSARARRQLVEADERPGEASD